MPTAAVKAPAMMRTNHMEMWIPGSSPSDADRKLNETSSKWTDASQPAT